VRLTDVVNLVAQRGAARYAEKRAGVLLPLAVGAMIPGIVHRAIEHSRNSERAMDQTKMSADMSWAGRPQGGSGSMFDFRRFNPNKAVTPRAQAQKGFGEAMPDAHGMGQRAGEGLMGGLEGLLGSPVEGVSKGVSGGISEMIKRKMLGGGREYGEQKDPMHLGGTAAIQTFGKGVGEMGIDLLRDMAAKAMTAASHAGDSSAREAILGELKRNDPVLADANDKVLMEAYHTMTRFAPTLSTDKNAVRSFLRQAVMSGSGPDYMSIKLLADAERAVTGGPKKD
jgi:hypothetical protein